MTPGKPRRAPRDTARALTVAVDRELISSLSTLGALATSEHLDTGDLRRFYAEVRDVWETYVWEPEELIDRGSQVVALLRSTGRGRSRGVSNWPSLYSPRMRMSKTCTNWTD